jgi:hypothetical protein
MLKISSSGAALERTLSMSGHPMGKWNLDPYCTAHYHWVADRRIILRKMLPDETPFSLLNATFGFFGFSRSGPNLQNSKTGHRQHQTILLASKG